MLRKSVLFSVAVFFALLGATAPHAAMAQEQNPASPAAPYPVNSGEILGGFIHHTVQPGETLIDIAMKYNVGFVALRAANPSVVPLLPPAFGDILVPDARIIPSGPRSGILINLPEMRLFYFGDKAGPRSYAIGIGREGLNTPIGSTTVARKAIDPTWYPTERMRREDPTLDAVVPPGPDNPLGKYALYLGAGWDLFRIHDTNKPWGIGRRSSSGCIRMYPADIAWLYPQIPLGTKVTVVQDTFKYAWRDGQLLMEAHLTPAQADAVEMDYPFPVDIPDNIIKQITDKAGDQADRLNWATIRDVITTRPTYPVRITS